MDEKKVKIKAERPPKWIWDEVHRAFEVSDSETIYTYGDTIYDPRNVYETLSDSVIVHEMEHMKQQAGMKGGPDAWWSKYLTDPEFRKQQEIEAYRVQYQHACTIYADRNTQARYLDILAGIVSSPMYKINLTKAEAIRLIKMR